MSLVEFKQKGNFERTNKLLTLIGKGRYMRGIEAIAQEGVARLKEYTPKDTGLTSESWSYKIEKTNNGIAINWTNSNINKGVNVAMIIQFGHGTSSGVYIEGVDYINPALQPIFDAIGAKVWREVAHSGK